MRDEHEWSEISDSFEVRRHRSWISFHAIVRSRSPPRRRRLRDRFGKRSFEIGCQIGWHYPSSERDLDPNRRAMPQLLQVPMFAQTLPMDAQKANQMSALP